MRTRIHKWGNSLALRIPATFVLEAGLQDNAEVDMRLVDGTLVVTPTIPKIYDLDELLQDVTPDNLHGEELTGGPVGKEVV